MRTKTAKLKHAFLQKQKILENARVTLKTEFIGIDRIIDEVIDNVSSWFFLSDIQEKPVVINLWGLTGVGKTSMVNRLVELIDFEDAYYRFDLGEKKGSFSFRDTLDDLCENHDTSPVIIALDEFQHSRTVSGPNRKEIETDHNRMIWELIDSGKIRYIDWKCGLWSFEELIFKLIHLINAGVKVIKGIVVEGKVLYCKEMNETIGKKKKLLFVPENEYERIIDLAGEKLGLYLQQDVKKILLSYSAHDTILFLNKVFKIGKRPSVKNFTKALVFVLGNLDEAFTMSSNFSADMDADEFNKWSLKITVPQIKEALQYRFRDEQIARLGNIHIIYPALNRKAYTQIIQIELRKVASSLTNMFGFSVEFDDSVFEIIYKEGVYPTQGVRPIFTSIHQVLKSKLSMFLSEIFLRNLNTDKLFFSINGKVLTCLYYHQKMPEHKKQVEIVTTLEDVRKNKMDDVQAITAVHESGHTVLSAILLRTIPEVVFSVTSDSGSHGFVYSDFAWDYVSRKELIPRVAMMLGGYVAEEMIFGKENLTSGAESDIKKATEFLSRMFKSSGMGSLPIAYSIPIQENNDAYHKFEYVESEIRKAIEEGKQLAEITLEKERNMLLVLSDFLSDNRMLRKKDIHKIVNDTISEKVDFINNGEHLFYRKHLKQEIKRNENLRPIIPKLNNVLLLNKDNK